MEFILKSLLLIFLPLAALAYPPTYGAEFEFVHPSFTATNDTAGEPQVNAGKMMFVNNLKNMCAPAKCVIEEVKGKWATPDYKVIFPDGFWFKVTHDPGCVEITTKPSTLAEFKAQEARINEYIFDSGKSLGFSVPNDSNAAHFNVGFKSAFDGSGEDFLRFFVDYHNKPELGNGILGNDIDNGPTLSNLSAEQRAKLQELVDLFYKNPTMTALDIAKYINEHIYTKSYNPRWGYPKHYQAIGMKYLTEFKLRKSDMPFEFRAIMRQENAGHFIRLAELMEARIRFNNSQRTKIHYSQSNKQNFSKTELISKFYIYVTEAGLNFEDYKVLLTRDLKNVRLDIFLDPKAKIVDRLENLKSYQELMPYSAWLQKYSQELIATAKSQGIAIDSKLDQILKQAVLLTPITCNHLF